MDEKLAGCFDVERSGNQLNVWMEISDEWCPTEIYTGPGLIIAFINYIVGSSKFAGDSKMSGAIDTPEGLNPSQRDLDKFKK